MARSNDFQFILSNLDLPDRADWQTAIQRWDLLLPLTIVDVSLEPDAMSFAEVDGRRVGFVCERRTVESVVRDRHSDLAEEWSFAYAFGGDGEMLSSLSAGIAALSYATSSNGCFYLPDVGPLHDLSFFREHLDEILAVYCDRVDLYRARYPAKYQDQESNDGSYYVVSEVI